MPIAHETSEKKSGKNPINHYCRRLRNNLETCIKKNNIQTECEYLKKVLQICQKRPKKIYRTGP